MLGVRSSRFSREKRDSLAKQKEKNVLFYPANSDSYSLSPTSTTSCETSLESSTYMEEQPFDCVELSPGVESTSSSQPSRLMREAVLKTNKYCGSAFVKARKQSRDRDELLQYDDPPLDHLHLFGPGVEDDSSSYRSKLIQEATLMIKQRNSVGELALPWDEAMSPPLPLPSTPTAPSTWPQSNWKTGSIKINTEYFENTSNRPSTSIRESLVNNIKAESVNVADDAPDLDRARKEKHIEKVKEMARKHKERTKKAQEQDDDQAKTKPSQALKDFVDHLLMVNATNQLCRVPPSITSAYVDAKKRVSWKGGDPDLPKPVLRRRSNSPVSSELPKPVLKRAGHFSGRFSSGPISCAPYDEDSLVLTSPASWKSVFTCGSQRKVLDSP